MCPHETGRNWIPATGREASRKNRKRDSVLATHGLPPWKPKDAKPHPVPAAEEHAGSKEGGSEKRSEREEWEGRPLLSSSPGNLNQ